MELYYECLNKNGKIIFNDSILTNINLFGFCSYAASIYAFKIMSNFVFCDYDDKYLDVAAIPKVMSLIKNFLENNFDIRMRFHYPTLENCVRTSDIDVCRKNLPKLKDDLLNFIEQLKGVDDILRKRFSNDLSYIHEALEKLICLIDNASNYRDSINRNYLKMSFGTAQIDLSKYNNKSKEEIDIMFKDDLYNNKLLPADYKRIINRQCDE